ncbi:MAG TPA: ATP-dependent DNA helicase RecG [Williamwhitmania sp.]|nr:ATP-dependent DNA helicase RecG [Williamwhitmania sp.]
MDKFFDTELKFLPGVGPKRAELLNKELQLATFRDLLYYFPFKYIDRSKFYAIAEITDDQSYVQIRGKIVGFSFVGEGRGKRLVASFTDGRSVAELVWFKGIKWIQPKLKVNVPYVVFGKPSMFNGKLNFVHPDVEDGLKSDGTIGGGLQAYYNTTEKLKLSFLNSKAILKLQENLHRVIVDKVQESLPPHLLQQLKLLPLMEALQYIHFPPGMEELRKAQTRLKFEELFFIQLNLLTQKNYRTRQVNGHVFSKVGDHFNSFYNQKLPFPLTEAQKRVLREIRRDLGSGRQMNRLLQGDVGSGKTLVGLMSMLLANDNGYQASIMAPTEILATQHFQTITSFLEGLDVSVALLTGSTKKSERKKLFAELEQGTIDILIGTHALLEDTVQFRDLGLVIIDEQQRFGVAQRAKLWQKNTNPPHILVMTATPIPRTLAMTVYGDLEVSVIDELPPGRKPINTIHYYDNKRLKMFGFIREQVRLGRQIYVVYPLIKESEKMDYKDLQDGYEGMVREFPPPNYVVVVVHGQMKSEEKDFSMNLFASGKAHIMVATTVIEVGVNVPNASVMIIESAERFGLSQLHQLRGRVGRGADQSYCILMTGTKLSSDSRKRISTMVNTNDGFEIAEVDLALRGPGDMEGTMQSGMAFDLKIANIAKDGQLLTWARNVATDLLQEDPLLDSPKNSILRTELQRFKVHNNYDFSKIS